MKTQTKTTNKRSTHLYTGWRVPKSLRDTVARHFPGLGDDEFLWGIMQMICFGGYDKERGVVLPSYVIREAAGDWSNTRSAKNWLDYFEAKTGIDLKINDDYNYREGMARTVLPNLPSEIYDALSEFYHSRGTEDRSDWVFFITGKVASERAIREELKVRNIMLESIANEDMTADHPAYKLHTYLEGQSQLSISHYLQRNIKSAREAAIETSLLYGWSEDREKRELDYIEQIRQAPLIHYKANEKTVRIFAIGITAVQLWRGIRKKLFAGAWELDLRYSQLAIAAKILNLPGVNEFLQTGESIWESLADHLGLRLTQEVKNTLKKAVYSTVYGMGKANLKDLIEDGKKYGVVGLGPGMADEFFCHLVIAELLDGRKAYMEQIERANGAVDAFGRTIPLRWEKNKNGCFLPNPRSVLAQLMQSYEMKIMLHALPVLEANDRITTIAWLHDGLALHIADHDKARRWTGQIKDRIDEYCRQEGFHTSLEVEQL